MGRRHGLGTALLVAGLVALPGCAVVVPVRDAPVGDVPVGAPMTECSGAPLAFEGEASLAQIGLEEFSGGPDAQRRGLIQVTAEPIVLETVPGRPLDIEPARWVCVQWADGSGMGFTIPDDWQLPAGVVNVAPPATSAEEGSLPLLPIALAGLVVAAVGVAVVAFRTEPRS